MQRCPHCGEENPDRFRLCGICGTALAPLVAAREVRKTVTVVFSDLVGSTSLGERLDSESLREVLAVYFSAMKAVLERHGGTVEKYIGDAVMAVFGLPRMHEDDALRAVRAALEMRSALQEVNVGLRARWGISLEHRTGVNTGEVVAGDPATGQRLATGDTVNVAARLEQAASGAQVLIGPDTYRLVREVVEATAMEPLDLKGKAERVPAYRVVSVGAGEAISRRVDTPMVGRDAELRHLLDSFRRAVDDNACRLVTLLGDAGVGKSRLVHELTGRLGTEARVLRSRCPSYGDGITFLPLAEVVRQAAGIGAGDGADEARARLRASLGAGHADTADRLASVMGLSSGTYGREELLWSARSALEALARRRPLVVVFDDIHWAQPTFLDLLEHLVDEVRGAPLFLVCAARYELLEERPTWAEGRETATRLELGELSGPESARVVRNLLGEAELPTALEERILAAADGNPLFVEQLLAMLVDEGVVREEDGRSVFVGRAEVASMPKSVSSLLASRLDRLGDNERSVLERASVIGLEFEPRAVHALDPGAPAELAPALLSLRHKQLIRPSVGFADAEAYQFSHNLVRDAAYEGLLKRTRASLHERYAVWLAAVPSAEAVAPDELMGYHLEQSFRYRRELGPIDGEARSLGARACDHLSSAGHRALARGDMPAAANLLERAAALLTEEDAMLPRLLLDIGEVLIEVGELGRAEAQLKRAMELAAAGGDLAVQRATGPVRLYLRYTTDPCGLEEEVLAEAERVIPRLEEARDDYALSRAWRLLAYVHGTANRFGETVEAAERTILHASAAGDGVMARRFLGAVAIAALYGPTPVPEAIARCEEVMCRAGDDRKATALAGLALAHLEAMRGEFQRARDLYRKSRASLEQFGWGLAAALTSIDSAVVEMLAGDLDAAERELRRDYEALQRMGERNYISTAAGLLAEVLYRQGRHDEAARFGQLCAELASAGDVASQFLWRCVQGKIAAHEGHDRRATAVLAEAGALMEGSDQLDWRGNGLVDLAEVHRLAGRDADAARCIAEAVSLFQRKGNVVSARRAAAFV